MKLLICSDIHGDLDSIRSILTAYERERCDRILILGDLLYHGPRNNLPSSYDPKEVINLLNANRDVIMSVKGNCDGEVDQMVLEFPIMADYIYLSLDGLGIFATHGHHHNTKTPPPLREGEVLLHGHTHVYDFVEFGKGNLYINPGSAALPKGGCERSYMVYEDRTFILKSLDGKVIKQVTL